MTKMVSRCEEHGVYYDPDMGCIACSKGERAAKDTSILEEAQSLIGGERRNTYGHPLDNHTCTADLFRIYYERRYGIKIDFDAQDTCYFNICQKISRDANLPERDNLVDGAGYFGNIEIVREP